MDSGATETVMNADMLTSVEVTEGAAYKRGVNYEVANGIRVPNEGEKKFKATTREAIEREVTAQVAAVKKSL